MIISLRLSESLLSIYHAAGRELAEDIVLKLEGPLTIDQILSRAGISTLLTPLISVNGVICRPEQSINEDAVITLIGPLAGG